MRQNSKENIDWSGTWVKRPFSHPERTIRIATSCSGIGAPEEALKQLGLNYEIVFAGDIDKYAKQSYFANHNITEDRWHDDIKTVDTTTYKDKVDFFVSGVCCQSFSRSNSTKRMGVDDPLRGDLYKSFIRIVNECKPKVFVFENVDDILIFPVKGEGITCWEKIRISLEKETGYDLHWQVMNARHYGVPQNRPRLFCVGFKEKTDFLFPAPIELKACLGDYLEKGVSHKNYLRQLTPDECIKLMGFGDFKKVVPGSQIVKQAGNSIVVSVLKALYLQMDISKYGI
jgi:DNA-methyltransferase (dcm)